MRRNRNARSKVNTYQKIGFYSGIKLILISILCSHISGCVDSVRRDQIREELVEQGVKNYIEERHQKCRQEAYLEADRIVDSMMLDQAFFTKIDTFVKPLKPLKPEMPPVKKLKDQDPVGPVINDL